MKGKTAKNKPRNAPRPPAKRPKHTKKKGGIFHLVGIAMVVIGLCIAVSFAMTSALFNLNQVNVEALSPGYPLTVEQVLELARVPLGRTNLFSLNLKPIEDRLMKNAWVRGVVVSKQFPHSLVLKIVERKPVALLNEQNGRVLYIEDDGYTFEDRAMVYGRDLPMISGFSANNPESVSQVIKFINAWFLQGNIPHLKLSSVSFDPKNGLRAMVIYPLKNKQNMRAMLELGQDIDEAALIPQTRLKKILEYLYERSTPASKIWLGDGKKIVVKVSRGS